MTPPRFAVLILCLCCASALHAESPSADMSAPGHDMSTMDKQVSTEDRIPLDVAKKKWEEDAKLLAEKYPRLKPYLGVAIDNLVAKLRNPQDRDYQADEKINRAELVVFSEMVPLAVNRYLGRRSAEKIADPAQRKAALDAVDKAYNDGMKGVPMTTVMHEMHEVIDEMASAQPGPKPGEPKPPAGTIPPGPPFDPFPTRQHRDDMRRRVPDNPKVAELDSRAAMADGDLATALAAANRAVDLGGGAQALALRGDVNYRLNDFAAARRDAAAAIEADPANIDALSLAHAVEGRDGPAQGPAPTSAGAPAASAKAPAPTAQEIAAVLSAAKPSPTGMDSARREAQDRLDIGDVDAAIAASSRGLALAPEDTALLNIRAAALARSGRYDEAIADASTGLLRDPRNALLLKTRAYADLRSGHYREALADADALSALTPKDAMALALRAHAHANLGERDAYAADLLAAAALDPRYKAAADAASSLRAPDSGDVYFLFPGESPTGSAQADAPKHRHRGVKRVVGGAAIAGGLLLLIGLWRVVASALGPSRPARTGPRVGPVVDAEESRTKQTTKKLPGLIRGQYQVLKQIGAGGMGLVYDGTDRSLDRRVAIKKMRDELRQNSEDRQRFVIEAKTVAALHHPNIVDIYAIAEESEDVFLVFEYVDGRTVHDALRAVGRFDVRETARIVRGAALALDYAHSRGVVHRDMKPSNMMLDASGTVKVMDFGIARMAKDAMTRYSATNTVVGTPPYMAPEQEQGHVRRESDVYALAVCAYELLTGKLPFAGVGAGILLNKINMKFVAPSRAIAGIPEALDAVFAKAFQADPERRYRTPKEFADALELTSSLSA
jgi:tetratricopeptide (TPR) repeat protein